MPKDFFTPLDQLMLERTALDFGPSPACAEDLAPMPSWAIGPAHGELVLGAHLATRDGRRCGNAHLVALAEPPRAPEHRAYVVLTDAGTRMVLTGLEIAELFYQPVYVSDVAQVLRRFGTPRS